jgi:hypothetical protein
MKIMEQDFTDEFYEERYTKGKALITHFIPNKLVLFENDDLQIVTSPDELQNGIFTQYILDQRPHNELIEQMLTPGCLKKMSLEYLQELYDMHNENDYIVILNTGRVQIINKSSGAVYPFLKIQQHKVCNGLLSGYAKLKYFVSQTPFLVLNTIIS